MLICFVFFFFKQKTAYEMRISDWSSDVCSSDLAKAQDYAKLAGFRGVELVSISEGSFGGGPQPPMPYARGMVAAEAKATPVEPGQVANTLTLNFQYRRSEEHTAELQSLMSISYAVFCLNRKKQQIMTPNNALSRYGP